MLQCEISHAKLQRQCQETKPYRNLDIIFSLGKKLRDNYPVFYYGSASIWHFATI
jgi:hypothetical protein